jgi:hypothetical protein
MGPMAVVMLHEDLEDALKMLMVQEQKPVRKSDRRRRRST